MSLLMTLAALIASESAACGGLFCDTTPVLQAAERIVFSVDETAQQVEMHVQVSYEGSAPEFAWVVPVKGVPELFLSADVLFTTVARATLPAFNLLYEDDGTCTGAPYWVSFNDSDADVDADVDEDDGEGGGGVDVLAEQRVGPYETVTLSADSAELLVDWLQANRYVIPDNLTPALAPYVAAGQNFVALRLANNADAGDIAPLGLRYDGTQPAIPIQLTSVAATPDMRLEVYLLGQRRFVPESYLHVTINEAAIDWFSAGANYDDTITLAADEAGGRAFATNYAGPSNILPARLANEYPLDALAETTRAVDAVQVLRQTGDLQAALAVLTDFIDVPDGRDPFEYINELEDRAVVIDGAALAQAIEERLVTPLTHIEDLFAQNAYLTALRSSVSAAEMTVDPTFVPSDLGGQSNQHLAVLYHTCAGGEYNLAARELRLADGNVLSLPPQIEDPRDTWQMSQDLGPAAATVTQFGADGEGVIVQDRRGQILSLIEQANLSLIPDVEDEALAACGCDDAGASVSAWTVAAVIALRRRRSRRG